jgi:hypothetical protein
MAWKGRGFESPKLHGTGTVLALLEPSDAAPIRPPLRDA